MFAGVISVKACPHGPFIPCESLQERERLETGWAAEVALHPRQRRRSRRREAEREVIFWNIMMVIDETDLGLQSSW